MNNDVYCVAYDVVNNDQPMYYCTDEENYQKICDYVTDYKCQRFKLLGKVTKFTFHEFKRDIDERTNRLLSNLEQYEKEKLRLENNKKKLEKDKQRLEEEIEKYNNKKIKFIKKRDSNSDSESSEDEKPKKKK